MNKVIVKLKISYKEVSDFSKESQTHMIQMIEIQKVNN